MYQLMNSGTVCIFNDINGNGLIIPDDGSGKISVSYRSIKKLGYKILNEGQKVKYDVQKMENGQNIAINVILIENSNKVLK